MITKDKWNGRWRKQKTTMKEAKRIAEAEGKKVRGKGKKDERVEGRQDKKQQRNGKQSERRKAGTGKNNYKINENMRWKPYVKKGM